ncbi:putative LIM domain-containing serine/threonine-protein kinase [Habropoda laboriosa]|uniref:non-specific serine/threonine protein kinase n=1 Tax=Habropoda laboriosa TaxID=597456 RepID=A0A0L7QST8_9HYME|nr:PREDICTED: serine/threonine-protein kinase mos [Habropoda laboriosa]KOC61536.1 putative LIM domain-containing serine/threonine-protein kinase [Habropoda laboriosa]
MASPRRLATKLCSISPRVLKNVDGRTYLHPRTPFKDTCKKGIENKNQLSPFNIDTPNRKKILKDGLPTKHGIFLGSGGFGTVYKASYKGDQVAAKVMQTEKCSNVLNCEKHASLLRHSNIVKVLMIEEGASLSLITMELCGTNLQDCLDETMLTKNERISILKGVTSALQFCHNAGIIHADVKPRNILMSADGQPKLTDFGSSILIGEPNDDNEFHGTPGYTAPEVIKGNRPTIAADIYSLGIVAWQMISRELPFEGLHSHTIIYLSAKGHRPKDNNIDDEFKGIYKTLYRKMWLQNPTDRPTTNEVINTTDTLISS